jgi:hypothetical protein
MPDPASHHPAMFTVKGNTLPRLWWLNPWSTARTLSSIVAALKTQNDRLDAALKASQLETIDEKRKYKLLRDMHTRGNGHGLHMENERLKLALRNALDSRQHWIAKAERAHAVALHNERVIREMEERSRG